MQGIGGDPCGPNDTGILNGILVSGGEESGLLVSCYRHLSAVCHRGPIANRADRQREVRMAVHLAKIDYLAALADSNQCRCA